MLKHNDKIGKQNFDKCLTKIKHSLVNKGYNKTIELLRDISICCTVTPILIPSGHVT
jgi:hypothetical protein